MNNREDKKLILNDLIYDWFNKQEDPYSISLDKLSEKFIFEEFIFENFEIEQLQNTNFISEILNELYHLHTEYIKFAINYTDRHLFRKPISNKRENRNSSNKKEIAQPKELEDMLKRAQKVCTEMEANFCNTNELRDYIRALIHAVQEKKGSFSIKKHQNKIKKIIEKELLKNEIRYKKYDLNEVLKKLTQQYLKIISSELINFDQSNLPKTKPIFEN